MKAVTVCPRGLISCHSWLINHLVFQDAKPDSEAGKAGQLYDVVAKAQMKKITKLWQQEVKKQAARVKREAEEAEAQRKRAEEAKKVRLKSA